MKHVPLNIRSKLNEKKSAFINSQKQATINRIMEIGKTKMIDWY